MKLVAAFAVAGLLAAPILAAPCRNAAGKFVKCDAASAKPLGAAAAQGNIVKGADGKCRIVNPAPGQKKGQFAPCPK